MFGYIGVKRSELKIKDDVLYRSFYCGLCRALSRRHGLVGKGTLSYDMTFLALLLTSLYETETREDSIFCPVHPGRRHLIQENPIIDYAADMNLLLAYYNLLDDWQDEKNLLARAGAGILKKSLEKISRSWPRQTQAVRDYVESIAALEKSGVSDPDAPAGATGIMMGELLVMEEDNWSETLRRLGFYLGKFIYLMDAYEDLEKDIKKGGYNPWTGLGSRRIQIADQVQEALTLMLSETCLAFESLPILLNEDILRNILYAGAWQKFDEISLGDKTRKEGGDGHGV